MCLVGIGGGGRGEYQDYNHILPPPPPSAEVALQSISIVSQLSDALHQVLLYLSVLAARIVLPSAAGRRRAGQK